MQLITYKTIIQTALIIKFLKEGKHVFVFLLLVLCPVFFENILIEPSNLSRFVVFSLVLLFCIIALIKSETLILPPTALFVLMAAFFLLNLLSTFWSFNKPDALYLSFKIFLGLCSFLYFYNVTHSEAARVHILNSLLTVGFLFCMIIFYKLLSQNNYSSGTTYNITIFSEHRNLVASAAFLFFGISMYSTFVFRGRKKLISIIISVFLFSALMFLQVRSVYFALLVCGLLFMLLWLIYSNLKRYLKIILSGSLILGLIIACVFLMNAYSKGVFKPTSLESITERFQLWEKTIQMVKDQPILGVGAGNWQYNYSKYGVSDIKNACQHNINFQQPHNDALSILSETGLFGLLLVIGIFLLVIVLTIKQLRVKMEFSLMVLFCFFVGIIFESFFSFPKERILHIVLLALILALLLSGANGPVALSSTKGKTLILIICSALIVGMFIGFKRVIGEYYTIKLLKSKDLNDARAVVRYGKKAISVFYVTDPTSGPIYSYMGWAYNTLGKNDSTLWASENSHNLSPFDYEELSNYGFALEKAGRRIDAIRILQEAIRINGCYQNSKINLALTYYNIGEYSAALKTLKSIPNSEINFASQITQLEQKLNK